MLYFSKLKLVSIYFVIFFLSLLSLANFFDGEDNILLSKKVNLGLDLQGGSYLLLEVNSEPIINQNLQQKLLSLRKQLKINNAELILKKKNRGDMNNYSQIEYTTYTTEEGFGNSRQNFQDLFTVEGDATQALMCFAQGSDNLLSSAPLTSFRCALNNINVTDRDVEVDSPLYYDRLASSLRGQGVNLRDLKTNAGGSNNFTYADLYNTDTNNVKPLVASLFQTSQNKFLQVKASVGTITYAGGAKSGVNDYQLFKAIPKVFAY